MCGLESWVGFDGVVYYYSLGLIVDGDTFVSILIFGGGFIFWVGVV